MFLGSLIFCPSPLHHEIIPMVELEQWSQTYTSSVQATPQSKTIETSVVVKDMGYRK